MAYIFHGFSLPVRLLPILKPIYALKAKISKKPAEPD